MGILLVQFGTQNNKHIVKLDAVVIKNCDGWYNAPTFDFYDSDGHVKTVIGVYLMYEGGYLCWRIIVCPY